MWPNQHAAVTGPNRATRWCSGNQILNHGGQQSCVDPIFGQSRSISTEFRHVLQIPTVFWLELFDRPGLFKPKTLWRKLSRLKAFDCWGPEVQGGQNEGRHGRWQVPQEEVGKGQGHRSLDVDAIRWEGDDGVGILNWWHWSGEFMKKNRNKENPQKIQIQYNRGSQPLKHSDISCLVDGFFSMFLECLPKNKVSSISTDWNLKLQLETVWWLVPVFLCMFEGQGKAGQLGDVWQGRLDLSSMSWNLGK